MTGVKLDGKTCLYDCHETKHDIRVPRPEHGEPGFGIRKFRSTRRGVPAASASIPVRVPARYRPCRDSDPGLFLECLQDLEFVSRRLQRQHAVNTDCRQSGLQSSAEPPFAVLRQTN